MKQTAFAVMAGFATVMSEAAGAGVAAEAGLVPLPKQVKTFSEEAPPVVVGRDFHLLFAPDAPGAREAAAFLASYLVEAGGPNLAPAPATGGKTADRTISLVNKTGIAHEGYELRTGGAVVLAADSPAGFFYCVQTLRQLLRADAAAGTVSLPGRVNIKDAPRFAWRGMMLDCCRHFFSVAEIRKILDLMASLKLNVFHWHLTEDHAWRLEIRQHPRLTEVGAWRDGVGFDLPAGSTDCYRSDGKYGGSYTQKEARELVAYAAQRHITVVPEIEMPGHSTAALAVYPELGCTGGPYTIADKGGVFEEVYCAGNDATIRFLKEVLDEVMEVFPSRFIHIGGDECPKTRWAACPKCQARMTDNGLKNENELQSWFIHQADEHLTSHGRRLVGWDEILEGGLAPNATVMSWQGVKGGIHAANAGHDVVMSPTTHCYFDYLQAKDGEPRGIGGHLPLEKVYEFDPAVAGIPKAKQKHVLGGQANVWTEYMPNQRHLEYMIAPRICALAEAVWSPLSKRDWPGFRSRMERQARRLDAAGFNYRRLDPPEEREAGR